MVNITFEPLTGEYDKSYVATLQAQIGNIVKPLNCPNQNNQNDKDNAARNR